MQKTLNNAGEIKKMEFASFPEKQGDPLLKFTIGHDILSMEVSVLQGGQPPWSYIRGEVVQMEFSFSDLILFASFLIALLAYIDRIYTRK